MEETHILESFIKKPYLIRKSIKDIAKRLKVSEQSVILAKNIFKKTPIPEREDNRKVLFLDIETAPMVGYVWGRWKQNIAINQTVSEWFMLSWAGKWANQDEVLSDVLTPQEALQEDDLRISKTLWEVLNQADVVVTHNGIKFDHPKINTRFLIHGLPPTRPFRIIDTLKEVKHTFSFSSNKLDNIMIQLEVDRKLETSFKLWKECLRGNQESLDYMKKYNEYDVTGLEKVFAKLKPWIRNIPHFTLYNTVEPGERVCPSCGSKHLKEDGIYTTSVNRYKLYRCQECQSVSRERVGEKLKIPLTNNIR